MKKSDIENQTKVLSIANHIADNVPDPRNKRNPANVSLISPIGLDKIKFWI